MTTEPLPGAPQPPTTQPARSADEAAHTSDPTTHLAAAPAPAADPTAHLTGAPAPGAAPTAHLADAPASGVDLIAHPASAPASDVDPTARLADAPASGVDLIAHPASAPAPGVDPTARLADAPASGVDPVARLAGAPASGVDPAGRLTGEPARGIDPTAQFAGANPPTAQFAAPAAPRVESAASFARRAAERFGSAGSSAERFGSAGSSSPRGASTALLSGPEAHLDHGDALVLDYLAELWAASDDLPPDLRDELMQTVTDYVAARRVPGTDPGPVLSRLGPPEHLAAATRRGFLPVHLRLPAPTRPAASPEPRVAVVGGGAESAAIALLIGGTFLMPVVSPAAGMLIATGSSRWTPAQKAAGWVLTAGSAAAAFLAVLVLAGMNVPAGPVLVFGYLATCAGSVVAGLALLAGMRSRP